MVADAESDGLGLSMDLLFVNAEGHLVRAHLVTVDEGTHHVEHLCVCVEVFNVSQHLKLPIFLLTQFAHNMLLPVMLLYSFLIVEIESTVLAQGMVLVSMLAHGYLSVIGG